MGASPLLGSIAATTAWDPDGPGPLTARLVAVGSLSVHGTPAKLAACDLANSTWSTFAPDPDGPVQQIVGLANGDLVIAGAFQAAGSVPASGIARWNGTSWAPLGAGLAGAAGTLVIRALTTLSNGDLAVAGNFTMAGGLPAPGLARWNGANWTAIPAAVTGGSPFITALAALPNGDLVVGGDFTAIGGIAAASIARWDGSAWSPFGSGFAGAIGALAVTGSGALTAAGHLFTGGHFVSQWQGSAWQSLASLPGNRVAALAGLPGSGVAAVGTFETIGGVAAAGAAAWDGQSWRALGAGLAGRSGYPNATVLTAMPGGSLVAVADYGPTRWDGVAWRPLSIGPQAGVLLLPEPGGTVLAAGTFMTNTGPVALCRWDGVAWTPVATPVRFIGAMARRANGNLVIAGDSLAEWNGTRWSVASNLTVWGGIRALLALPDGGMLVAGQFWAGPTGVIQNIARWDDGSWSGLGAGLGLYWDTVRALALLPNGDVVAGGDFNIAGNSAPANYIARWNGAIWSPLGSGTNAPVRSLAAGPNGEVYAAGLFSQAGGVPVANLARWNGTTWSAMPGLPSSQSLALTMLPGGDVVATGSTWPSATAQPLVARWNGASWTRLDAGLTGSGVFSAAFGAGGLYVGGGLTSAGGAPATAVAQLASTCPATVLPWGSGCAGLALTATAPWLGSSMTSTAIGPTVPALGFLVSGFAPTSVLLQTVVPAALPGCLLMVQPEHVQVVPFQGGVLRASVALPNQAALTGIVLRQQLLAMEQAGAFAVTASNALLLTLGSF